MVGPGRALVATLTVAAVLMAVSASVPSARPAPSPANMPALDESEMAQAQRTGRRVEVPTLGSPTRQVFANPGGTFTARMFTRPARVRHGSGWVNPNTTLMTRPDGLVAPIAAADVEFSGGGTTPLARLRVDGRELILRWPHPLPRPVLVGNSARYGNVFAGVDLIVHATETGFSKVLVVRSAAAARAPELSRLSFGWSGTGLTVRTDTAGTTAAVDDQGNPVVTFGAAWMWDSSGGPHARGPGGQAAVARDQEPAAGDRRSRMGLEVASDRLTIVPDQVLLTDPDTTFPVYLDPQWPGGRQHWLMVEQDLPGYGWWDSSYQARVGRDPDDSTTDRFRSYFQVDTSFVAGKLIKKAIFTFNEKWRYSCTPEPVYLWSAAPSTPSSTWSDKPALVQSLGSVTTPRTGTDCDTVGLVEFDVKTLLSEAAAARRVELTVALVSDEAAGTNGAKAFDNNPFIDIEYNTVPQAPVQISTAGVSGCSDATPIYVNKNRPELRVRLVDDDAGQSIRATLEWREVGATTSRTLDSAPRVAGDEAPVTVSSTLLEGHTYEWRARAYNKDVIGDVDAGPYTAWCRFVVDTKAPTTTPVVTRVCPASCPGLQVDQPAQFLFDAAGDADIVAFSYAPNLTSPTTKVEAVGAKATVTVSPEAEQLDLVVYGVDRAGNVSPLRLTTMAAQKLPDVAASWPVERDASGVLADSSAGAHPIGLYGGYSWQIARDGTTSLGLDGGANTGGHTTVPVVHTNNSFTVMAWVRLDDSGDWRTVLSQAATVSNGFELRFDMNTRAWAFVMRTSDVDGAPEDIVRSNTVAQAGVWTHLAGEYDHTAGELRLYVDGRLAGRAAHHSTWDARGSFAVGYRNYVGFAVSRWLGLLDDIRVYPFAASSRKISQDMASDAWGTTAWWQLDSNLDDSTPANHTLSRIGATDWTTRRQGSDALSFNGSDGQAYTANPVVHTNASFSVAAWVRLVRDSATAMVVSQDGDRDSGFSLGYVNGVGWGFLMKRADTTVASDSAIYPAPVQVGVWTHLAAVYDKNRQRMSLYVDGALAATAIHEATTDARGSMVLGRGQDNGWWTSFWPGAVDDVQVSGTAATPGDVSRWMASDVSFAPQGTWDLDDQTGTTRRDVTGNGHALYVAPGVTATPGKRGGGLLFDGSAGAAAFTARPVSPTNANFTVAAWLRLDAHTERSGTGVSQDGVFDSGFTLGYDADAKRWKFAMSREDRADGSGSVAVVVSQQAPQPSVWTHLAGTYDSAKQEMKLYVDGELVGTTPQHSTWNAGGPLVLGRGKLDGTPRDGWSGAVDEARIVDRLMSPEEVRSLLVSTTLGPGAWWPLDESSGIGAPDASGNGYPLALSGATAWTMGRCGNGLLFDGVTGQAAAPGPVLHTDESFSVAAWVRLDAIASDAAAMSQDGLLASSFYLGYNSQANKWWFILPSSDSSSPQDVVTFSAAPAQAGVWTHLAGVYDAQAHEMRLYVDGVPSAATVVSTAWNAVGATRLSGAQWNGAQIDYWPGLIDDARVLARAVSTADIGNIIAACPPGSVPQFDNLQRLTIPDLSTVESAIVTSGTSSNGPGMLTVDVTIRHTFRGDLSIDLIGPTGRTWRLKEQDGSDSTDDVVASYHMDASGEPANGTWRLRVRDGAAGDSGYLERWSLAYG